MRITHILPLVLFAVVALALGIGLTLNPRIIPSALIDKPIPEFTLPPVSAGVTRCLYHVGGAPSTVAGQVLPPSLLGILAISAGLYLSIYVVLSWFVFSDKEI